MMRWMLSPAWTASFKYHFCFLKQFKGNKFLHRMRIEGFGFQTLYLDS